MSSSSCTQFLCESRYRNTCKAEGSHFTFLNISTRTTFVCFPLLRNGSVFKRAFSHASFIVSGGHSAQYINYQVRWNVSITICPIFATATGKYSFVVDVPYKWNLSEESEGKINNILRSFFVSFRKICDTDPTYQPVAEEAVLFLSPFMTAYPAYELKWGLPPTAVSGHAHDIAYFKK